MAPPTDTVVIASVRPSPASPTRVAREFRALVAGGAALRPAGTARRDPGALLRGGYTPRYRVDLFDTRFYLTNVRQTPEIRFFVAYVVQPSRRGGRLDVFPRLFYKDVSLVWRVASHYVRDGKEIWIGKGDVRTVVEDGTAYVVSVEESTNLPLEIQSAMETLLRRVQRVPTDLRAIDLVLRRGAPRRTAPFEDFAGPRRRAADDPHQRIHGGRRIARFTRRNDPRSLVFARGFAPDFAAGVLDIACARSRLYGGRVHRVRIVSLNRAAQYLFFAAPAHIWIGACQSTATALTSYGIRAVDPALDEELLLPGYEYDLYREDSGEPELLRQIPKGFAGAPSSVDPQRADTRAWLDAMPVIREFRRRVLPRLERHRDAGAAT